MLFHSWRKPLCNRGLVDEAKELLGKMEDNGCLLDNATSNLIVHGFLKSNKTNEAMALLKEIIQRGFPADKVTMSLLIELLLLIGEGPFLLNMIPKLHLRNEK
ncbi:hypothetical protein R3W88_010740 [Solanum pinnatisectum]|uniref:Pentatricopeptide repeat-containing protein n=1 Tax=Solanum pinnatisectum TaxID=50273 RepID=A0AAV9L854_9SOLN|nr:hypothetical protein R3W88_010740 [Solanum pinnatisectum]